MYRISFNINKEKRIVFNNIKMLGINEDGIVYGGMVRDEIIATHYKSLFDEFVKPMDPKPYDRFWDRTFHPESNKRMLIPDDMDIYFKTNDRATAFIERLTSFANTFNGRVCVHNVPRTNSLFYVLGENFAHKIVKIYFKIGRTFSFAGHKIEIKIDVVINTTADDIEPPFSAADFSSNLFLMSKTSLNRYEIRLSKNTGTPLDQMVFLSKRRAEMRIIEDMIQGKIEFIRNIDSINSEYINGSRILKMLSKETVEYQITNLLFREVSVSPCSQNCDICLEMINADASGSFIEILTNKHATNVMHKNCFIGYLTKEIAKRYRNTETGQIECRCTRRNSFNFKESYRFSSVWN